MKPAVPVTSQVRLALLMRCCASAYAFTFTPGRCKFAQAAFVAVDHRALGKPRLNCLARVTPQLASLLCIGERGETVDQRTGVTCREEEAVVARPDHLRRSAYVGVHHRQAERHRLDRGERERLG